MLLQRFTPGDVYYFHDPKDAEKTQASDRVLRGSRPVLVLNVLGKYCTCVPFSTTHSTTYANLPKYELVEGKMSTPMVDNVDVFDMSSLTKYLGRLDDQTFTEIKNLVKDNMFSDNTDADAVCFKSGQVWNAIYDKDTSTRLNYSGMVKFLILSAKNDKIIGIPLSAKGSSVEDIDGGKFIDPFGKTCYVIPSYMSVIGEEKLVTYKFTLSDKVLSDVKNMMMYHILGAISYNASKHKMELVEPEQVVPHIEEELVEPEQDTSCDSQDTIQPSKLNIDNIDADKCGTAIKAYLKLKNPINNRYYYYDNIGLLSTEELIAIVDTPTMHLKLYGHLGGAAVAKVKGLADKQLKLRYDSDTVAKQYIDINANNGVKANLLVYYEPEEYSECVGKNLNRVETVNSIMTDPEAVKAAKNMTVYQFSKYMGLNYSTAHNIQRAVKKRSNEMELNNINK